MEVTKLLKRESVCERVERRVIERGRERKGRKK